MWILPTFWPVEVAIFCVYHIAVNSDLKPARAGALAAAAAAPLPCADLAVTHDGLAVLESNERHGVLVAVPQVEMLYHSRHGPVVLWPSN